MAITSVDVNFLGSLKERGLIPEGDDVIQIGEANWYGDVDVSKSEAFADVKDDVWATARRFYHIIFGYRSLDAIDMHGPTAWPYDLNEPVPVAKRYGVLINCGTAEHVFNQRQVWKTMHELVLSGGLMYHHLPMTWHDHGLFNYNPTFVRDLCEANRYELVDLAFGCLNPEMFTREEPDNANNICMVCLLRKPMGGYGFLNPQQGMYRKG